MPRENRPIVERPSKPRPGREGDLIRKIDREDPWPPPPTAPGTVATETDEDDREEEATDDRA
jgi:hypothetical protein